MMCFVKAHGNNVELKTFERLKPYYVWKLKEKTHVFVNTMLRWLTFGMASTTCKVKATGFMRDIVHVIVMFIAISS